MRPYDTSVFKFLRNHYIIFSWKHCHTVFSPVVHRVSSFSVPSPAFVSCVDFWFCFLVITILTVMRYYLIVILICTSLLVSDVVHLFCTCMSFVCHLCIFWRSVYLSLLPIFKLIYILLLSYRRFFNVSGIHPLSGIWFTSIFPVSQLVFSLC